ncbi:MAG: hypothetical protein ABH883_06900 [Candidatus Omnitrophota bacterium]
MRTESFISKKWCCKYFIKERYVSSNINELRQWINIKKRRGIKKNCHILREFDTKTGVNKIVCKVLGDLYVIWGRTALNIVYINEVKIRIGDEKNTGNNF